MWNFVAAFTRNQIKIISSVDKAFWDETKSFLQYKGAPVELKRAKIPVNQFFQSPRRRPPPPLNYTPRGKTVTAAYIHKALAKIYSGFWALKNKHVWKELVFCQAHALAAIAAAIFNNGHWKRRQDVLSAPLLPYFIPPAFYLFLKVKSELASWFLTQGTFNKSV